MYKQIFIALLILGISIQAYSQKENFKQHITYLADDKLVGRFTGSAGEKQAATYIIEQLSKSGINNLKGNKGKAGYLQQFIYHPKTDKGKSKVSGSNVVAYIDNGAANTVVIGAHYDHLGMGDPHHSTYRGEPAVHNGADDNASGVAMVIELGKRLKGGNYKNNNYLLLFFSGEELGLYGSKWFVEHPMVDLKQVNYMINFDMVGRVDSNKIVVYGTGTSPQWMDAMNIKTPLHIKQSESGVGPSDHTSFYLKDIPVLHIFSGQHSDYHKPSDDEAKINYAGMEDIFNYTLQLISNTDRKGKIGFSKTKDDNHDNAPKFSVTLGVMPDYTYEGDGMRIDGVTEGKPASKAGLEKGDIVVQLGDIPVKDMMSYMQALSKFKKGDATKVKVKRKGETVEKDIQF